MDDNSELSILEGRIALLQEIEISLAGDGDVRRPC